MSDTREMLAGRVRVMQIIALVLPMGVIVFAAIAVMLRSQNAAAPAEYPIVSYFGIGFFAIAATMSFVVPRFLLDGTLRMIARGNDTVTEGRLAGVYQTNMILSLAFLEGSMFLAIVGYLTEGHAWALAPVLVGLGLMGLRLPTLITVEEWIERQARRIEELRRDTRS